MDKNLTGYECPKCGEDPPDEAYTINNKNYPIVSGYSNDCSMEVIGGGHSWDETHYCEECEIEFGFINADY